MSQRFSEVEIPVDEYSVGTTSVNGQGNSGYSSYQAPRQDSRDDTDALSALASKLGFGTATGNVSAGQLKEIMVLFEQAKQTLIGKPGVLAVKLLPIEDNTIFIGSVAMYYKLDKTIYYTVFLFESTAKYIPNKTINSQGRIIEIDLTTDKYFDARMKEVVEANILYHEGQDNHLFAVSAIVVPKRHPVNDIEHISPIVDYGMANITNVIKLNNRIPTDPLTAMDLKHYSLSLVNSIQITPGATYTNYFSQPTDGDFNIILSVRKANKQDNRSSIHAADEDICLTSVIGRVDFFRYINNQPQQPVYGMPPQAVPGYVPVVIMTQVSRLGKSTQVNDTLLSQLLGFASLMPLINTQDNRWTSVFEQQVGEYQKRTSIGVMGLEHNPFPGLQWSPAVVDIVPNGEIRDANKFTASEFAQIYCMPSIMVALDILKGGPLEKIQNIIATAQRGSNSERLILKELDAFSDGLFSQIWLPKEQPIIFNSTIIHAGFYTDDENKQRDIRSIDYLAALEWCGGNQQILSPFVSGFLPDTNSIEHLDQKRKSLQQAVQNLTITGLYQRVFINNAFISALDEMFSRLDLTYLVEGMNVLDDVNVRRHSINSSYFAPIQSHGTFYNRAQNQYGGTQNTFQYGTGLTNDFY